MAKKKAETITGGQFRALMKPPKPGAYLFWGDENYLKHVELTQLKKKLFGESGDSDFDHYIFTDDNYDCGALLSAIMSPAMTGEFKLVELYCLSYADMRRKDDRKQLEDALAAAAESDDTITIIYTTAENFDPGTPKKPSEWMKLLSGYATPVSFEHEPTNRLIMWVQKRFTSDRIIAENSECGYLIDRVGHDMSTLIGEIDKVRSYIHSKERDKLYIADIDYVCCHNREIGAFDFANAIIDAKTDKAFEVLHELRADNENPISILSQVTSIYIDMLSLKLYLDAGVSIDEAAKRLGISLYPAKLRAAKARLCTKGALEAIIGLCADTDSAMKSTAADDYILLERLIVMAAEYRKRNI